MFDTGADGDAVVSSASASLAEPAPAAANVYKRPMSPQPEHLDGTEAVEAHPDPGWRPADAAASSSPSPSKRGFMARMRTPKPTVRCGAWSTVT